MKIVETGKFGKVKDWKMVVACPLVEGNEKQGCGAKLEVRYRDLHMNYSDRRPYVECPECGKYVYLQNKDVPLPLLDRLVDRCTPDYY